MARRSTTGSVDARCGRRGDASRGIWTVGENGVAVNRWVSGEWAIEHTSAQTRRTLHYWMTILWVTVGLVVWIILRNVLWFVGFMSLYAIWVTHLAGWAAETPVEAEEELEQAGDAERRDSVVPETAS